MQRSVSYFDNYEKFDCTLFHDSLTDKQYFESEDVESSGLDQDTLNDYSFTFEQPAENIETPKIPHYTSVKYQKEAYGAWKSFYQPSSEAASLRNYVNGTLSCFCDDQYRAYGYLAAVKYYRADGLN
jgi:hypothetical protein